MRVADKLLNKAEEMAFRELEAIAQDNSLRLFAKPRLSDVILKDSPLPNEVFDFYTKAHVDFVVTDQATRPLIIVEYDGPVHSGVRQQRRDRTKDDLCINAGLGVLRIDANHVARRYRGMSVLRWIIEVTELERWFSEAQAAGHIPYDEPFDAAMVVDDGKGRRWPYWLSASATQVLHSFLREKRLPKSGWAGIIGSDAHDNLHELAFCWFGDQAIWSKVGVRRQNFRFPAYDLLRELSICELESKLRAYRNGRLRPVSDRRLQQVCEDFCTRYDAHPSYSSGGSGPFNFSWSPSSGWKFA